MSSFYKVKIENSLSKTTREVVVLAERKDIALKGCGISKEEVAEISKINPLDLGTDLIKAYKNPNAAQLSDFYDSLVQCLNIGTTMVESLSIVSLQQDSPLFRGVIGQIIHDLSVGISLSEAMAKFPRVFSKPTLAIIKAGETSGDLKTVLYTLARSEERYNRILGKIKGALYYPAIVLVTTFISVMFIGLKLVPQLEALYKNFDATLPLATKMVLWFSVMARTQPLFWIILIGSIVTLIYKYKDIIESDWFIRFSLKLPIFGEIFRKSMIARAFRVLSMLLNSGVRVKSAFDITAMATGFSDFKKSIEDSGQKIVSGEELHIAFTYNKEIFGKDSDRFIAFLRLAAHTGAAGDILSRVANTLDDDVEKKTDVIQRLLEPILLGIIAVIVGGVIIAVYYPIFNLGSALGH